MARGSRGRGAKRGSFPGQGNRLSGPAETELSPHAFLPTHAQRVASTGRGGSRGRGRGRGGVMKNMHALAFDYDAHALTGGTSARQPYKSYNEYQPQQPSVVSTPALSQGASAAASGTSTPHHSGLGFPASAMPSTRGRGGRRLGGQSDRLYLQPVAFVRAQKQDLVLSERPDGDDVNPLDQAMATDPVQDPMPQPAATAEETVAAVIATDESIVEQAQESTPMPAEDEDEDEILIVDASISVNVAQLPESETVRDVDEIDGPPPLERGIKLSLNPKERKQAKKERRKARKSADRNRRSADESMLDGDRGSIPGRSRRRRGSDIVWGDESSDEPVLAELSLGDCNGKKQDIILADYIANIAQETSSDEADVTFASTSTGFLQSMDKPVHLTIDDVNDEIQLRRPINGWRSETDEENEDWETDSVATSLDEAMAHALDLASDRDDQPDSSSEEEDEVPVAQVVASSDTSDEEDEDEDEGMFNGQSTWADRDEAFIDDLARLHGSSRKAQRDIYRMVLEGDFPVDFTPPSRKGKGSKSKANKGRARFDSSSSSSDEDFDEQYEFDDAFDQHLQDQWQKDRAKKADFKRRRAEARAEKQGTKASKKAAKRAAQSGFTPKLNMDSINDRIRTFIVEDIQQASIAFPPMSKTDRRGIHLLAEAYQLKSKSSGKGATRFPVLYRTARTSVYGVNQKNINIILKASSGNTTFEKPTGKGSENIRGLLRDMAKLNGGKGYKQAARPTRSLEGTTIGQGAAELDASNIGFQLLAKMGWSQGAQIGVSDGLSAPLTAIIKTTKRGLGS
ncbi:uncharacterized protein L969DRAFT_85693 [Mixia osmundae IAM 14324]|uniref:Protein SQS1 n=1 Tax=Mixia osmundae (strain CBS 9802 / IAM 14324 / JCM 22182 / KY 12970) TaxID=764103 RepID=G7E664_MIXOS|nr:uncharacterized protein L969DRAFT_85693 [Mixia osmundae IAM 14324]KEI40522.1 hypothetical protein L969DRAFT_85693 [Mixia osmundae IAM 14324]GAA98324.1 hypothetical protein E5Q_05009 [Mixia osmundae IAM 14324]